LFNVKGYGNKNVAKSLLEWVLQKNGIVRVKTMSYHGTGVEHK